MDYPLVRVNNTTTQLTLEVGRGIVGPAKVVNRFQMPQVVWERRFSHSRSEVIAPIKRCNFTC
jgi:hypothetical protein